MDLHCGNVASILAVSTVRYPYVARAAESTPMILRTGDFCQVQTNSEEARSWFDQGMALMLGYNFDGALLRLEAIRRDPEFAMAWWGIAYAS